MGDINEKKIISYNQAFDGSLRSDGTAICILYIRARRLLALVQETTLFYHTVQYMDHDYTVVARHRTVYEATK